LCILTHHDDYEVYLDESVALSGEEEPESEWQGKPGDEQEKPFEERQPELLESIDE
jgi:hypothetical protein